jgi:hypothetical protein
MHPTSSIHYQAFRGNQTGMCSVIAGANMIQRDLPKSRISQRIINRTFNAIGGTQQGAFAENMLDSWLKNGFEGTHITGYFSVSPTDTTTLIQDANASGIYAEFWVPGQPGQPWRTAHAALMDSAGPNGVDVVLWGVPTHFSWAWWESNGINAFGITGLRR